MTSELQTPWTRGEAVDLAGTAGRVWRKQLLPIREVKYKGQILDFTKERLAGYLERFKAGALDRVPFLLADADNRHTMDPTRLHGTVEGMELADDGLDVIVKLSDEADRIVRMDPTALGVSARILPPRERSDGKTFGETIGHVLGTLDPRVPGMRPWTPVELSTTGNEVIDLTAIDWNGDGSGMAGALGISEQAFEALSDDTRAAIAADLSATDEAELTDEQLFELLADLEASGPDPDAGDGNDEDGDEPYDPTTADEPTTEAGDRPLPDYEQSDEEPSNPDGSDLSYLDRGSFDLDDVDLSDDQDELAGLRAENARLRAAELVAAGVPPYIVELAQPLLDAGTIDLSNGDELDVAGQVAKILDEVKGYVDLSGEKGRSVRSDSDEDAAAQVFLDQSGIG